jgi:hypothetical protein
MRAASACPTARPDDRRRFVIAVGVDGGNLQARRKLRNLVARVSVQDVQSTPGGLQGRLQLAHRLPDERDPAIPPRQRIQDLLVEDKGAVDCAMGFERPMQRGMVKIAQVAPEPDERGGHL